MSNVILPNNNTSLYNSTGNAVPTDGNISANNINATGNVTVGGFITANGSITTNSNFVGNLIGNVTGNITGNLVLTGGNTEVIYNNNGVTGSSPAFTFDYAANVLDVSGDINTGTVSATGNITADYYFGDGSQLTGLPATYGNANVADYLPTYTGNLAGGNLAITTDISATGNITGNYILGNGALLSGLPATYSNANVQAYLPTYTGNLNPNTISATGNITGLNLKTSGATGNIVGANYVSANFYLGDGGLLSNVTSNYGNTEVNAHLAAFGSNAISTTGNITAGYFIGDGSLLTGLPAGYSNTDVNNHLAAFGSNVISTTGNITASNFVGNVAGANVIGAVANATYADSAGTATTVTGNAQANITSVGTLTDLSVSGNINTTTLSASGNVTGNYLIGDGSFITNLPGGSYGNANVANYLPTFSGNLTAGNISATGNITGSYFIGNGSQLTGLPAGYSNTDVNAHLAAFGSNVISTTGNVTAGNFIGNIAGIYVTGNVANADYATLAGSASTAVSATTANTVTGNAQANITSVGTLTGVSATGNISTTGNVVGAFLWGDGSNITGVVSGSKSTQLEVKNTSGNTITKGTPVYATGSVGASTRLEIAPSLGNTAATMPAIGILTTDLADQAEGYAISVGTLTQANTAAYATGQVLYVASGGGLTGSRPTGTDLVQPIGAVGRVDNTTGTIETNIWNYLQLPNLGNGNVWVGNSTGYPTEQVAYGNTQVAAYLPTYTGNITANVISATGNITGAYVLGNGSQLTALAIGSNTQIQFNDSGNLAGNVNMTFDKSSGNVILGNVAINGLRILPDNTGNVAEAGITANVTTWQLRIGNSYNGNTAWNLSAFGGAGAAATGVGARVLQSDVWNLSNSGARLSGITAQNYVNLTANITNGAARIQGMSSFVAVGGGASGNTVNTTNSVFPIQAFGSGVAVGNVNPNLSIGNTTVSYINGQLSTLQVGNGSQANYITGMGATILNSGATANIGNVFGYHVNWSSATGGNATTYAVYYHPGPSGSTALPPVTTGNVARNATNYHAFRNDDNLAKSRLGSVEKMHYWTSNVAITSGNITVDKNNGQVQNLYMTENVSGVTFSNFITRTAQPNGTQINQTDRVTLVVQQDATGWDLTFPTGNTNIRYANSISAVGNTANSTTLVEVTATYNYNDSAVQYLVNIGPEYT